ncbi:hypothetical protein ETC01_03455 [Geobacillus sp. NFOSA3]|nr:hypothetical protein [Geobacillus sp. NFOSA3]OXB93360.1 hypothetical protein B9L23_13585 [Parageobacillus galactosidasius]
MIHWMPPVTPFDFAYFITELIFNPLRTFLAMICFFIGFLANAVVIRTVIEGVILCLQRKQVRWKEWFICCGGMGSFYWLFQWETRLAALFFIFSLIYGMISVDLDRSRQYNRNL